MSAMLHDDPTSHDDGPMFVAKLTRRGALGAFAALGVGLLAACGGDDDSGCCNDDPGFRLVDNTVDGLGRHDTRHDCDDAYDATMAATGDTVDAYLDFPEETNGPFPADGSNDNGSGTLADVLTDSRVVRSDITANLDGSDQQPGIPMALTMMLGSGGAALAGAAVYIWHCSRDGHYSVYSGGMNGGDYSDSTWFRGVQVTDASGAVSSRRCSLAVTRVVRRTSTSRSTRTTRTRSCC